MRKTPRLGRFRVLTACVISLAACSPRGEEHRERALSPDKSLVAASVYPLSFLVREIGGPHVEVVDLVKPGLEPHDAELTASQIRTISQSDLVVLLGGHFQPVVERAVAEMGDRAFDVLPFSELADTEHAAFPSGEQREESHFHGAAQGHDDSDPHVWLDPMRMRRINAAIAHRLARLVPTRAAAFLSASDVSDAKLDELHRSFSAGLRTCERREIATGHGAFGYLAERYGLVQIPIGPGLAENEPTPGRMARLAVAARGKGIRTIFYERRTSAASAETLAREIGARTAILDSVEARPLAGDYLSAMRQNLRTLRAELDCR